MPGNYPQCEAFQQYMDRRLAPGASGAVPPVPMNPGLNWGQLKLPLATVGTAAAALAGFCSYMLSDNIPTRPDAPKVSPQMPHPASG